MKDKTKENETQGQEQEITSFGQRFRYNLKRNLALIACATGAGVGGYFVGKAMAERKAQTEETENEVESEEDNSEEE